jgi:hypothetical protein
MCEKQSEWYEKIIINILGWINGNIIMVLKFYYFYLPFLLNQVFQMFLVEIYPADLCL